MNAKEFTNTDQEQKKFIVLPCSYTLKKISKEQKRTTEKKDIAVGHYTNTWGNISKTCRMTGISRWTFYDWMKKDFKFTKRLFSAMEKRAENITKT